MLWNPQEIAGFRFEGLPVDGHLLKAWQGRHVEQNLFRLMPVPRLERDVESLACLLELKTQRHRPEFGRDVIEPVGFGPIAPGWETRKKLLGRHAGSWSLRELDNRSLPAGIDSSFFNCAPIDQRIDEIRCNERITLENLHPQEAHLACQLPGLRPRAFAERTGAVR